MSDAYIGQISMMAFSFAPRDWALCDGQLLPIAQNQSLYAVIGTAYGGDGRTTFALPDLRGRLPTQQNATHTLGSKGGAETIPLTTQQMGMHHHALRGSSNSMSAGGPAGRMLGTSTGGRAGGPVIYELPPDTQNLQALSADSIAPAGQTVGHENMQPSLVVSFAIALRGVFPPRN